MMIDPFQTRRVGMTLFTSRSCIEGHACRVVLYEKEVECDVEYIDMGNTNPDENPIITINPYGESPTLVDRDLELYGSHIIAEYLDERLPHPPLMPPDPVSRGKVRLMIYRCQRDWFSKLRHYDENNTKPDTALRKIISQDLTILAPYLSTEQFWLGEDFSLADCFIAPLLWRLNHYGIELPVSTRAIRAYKNRLFSRPSFQSSLSSLEREMF